MRGFSRHVAARAVVYDCMDDLASFRFAPPDLAANEVRLMAEADVVFTGGHALWEARRHRHDNVHAFPSSVDAAHFAAARAPGRDPADQAGIPRPRLGYYGVIDERLDLGLVADLARARPDWQVVMVGPLAKLSQDDLPRAPNLHWLGAKAYGDLPDYLRGWDAALMPFALNDATRSISPTKTPEYLAAGRPVVSTPVRDVVRAWGDVAAVRIADGSEAFAEGCATALAMAAAPGVWRDEADRRLATSSWDATARHMARLVAEAAEGRVATRAPDRFPAPGLRRGVRGYDVTIAGAGFAGAVLAERLAEGSGLRVLVVDRRDHVGGNAYDHHDAAGVLVHRYGPHIFHTNSDAVVYYLSRFTRWRPYEHRVLASVGDALLPIPINRTTVNALYGLSLADEAETAAFLAAQAEPVDAIPAGWRAGLLFPDHAAGRGLAARGRGRGPDAAVVAADAGGAPTAGAGLLHVRAGIGREGRGPVRAARAAGARVARTERLPWLPTDPAGRSADAATTAGVDAAVAVSRAWLAPPSGRHAGSAPAAGPRARRDGRAGHRHRARVGRDARDPPRRPARAAEEPLPPCRGDGAARPGAGRRVPPPHGRGDGGAGDARAEGFAPADVVAATFGHETGHTADPDDDLPMPIPAQVGAMLGIFLVRRGLIAANGVPHAHAPRLGGPASRRGPRRAARPGPGRKHGEALVRAPRASRRGVRGRSRPGAVPAGGRAAAGLRGDGRGRRLAARQGARSRRRRPARSQGRPLDARTRPESLHRALRSLRPQGPAVNLAFHWGEWTVCGWARYSTVTACAFTPCGSAACRARSPVPGTGGGWRG